MKIVKIKNLIKKFNNIAAVNNGFYAMSKRNEITNRSICSPVKRRYVIFGKPLGNIVFATAGGDNYTNIFYLRDGQLLLMNLTETKM